MKSLIVYYSFEGNTKFIADLVQQHTGADVMQLKTKMDSASKGFSKYLLGGAGVIFKTKPTLLNESKNVDDYDVIYIGTPIWAGDFTPAINSFLAKNKIEGKKIVVFTCHGGGGDNKCIANITKKLGCCNSIVGCIDFVEPLKADKMKVAQKAKVWLSEIDKKLAN